MRPNSSNSNNKWRAFPSKFLCTTAVAAAAVLVVLLSLSATTDAYSAARIPTVRRRSRPCALSPLTMRRGQGKLGKELGLDPAPAASSPNSDGDGTSAGGKGLGGLGSGGGGGAASSSGTSWIPIQGSSSSQLPSAENQVALLDTNLPTMKNAQTNPTGAVSVLKYQNQMYCFAVNCPTCKIPLTKARAVLAPAAAAAADDSVKASVPVVVCDFCKSSFHLKTGAKLAESVGPKPGLFGGIAKSLFNAQRDTTPLKVYKLGEKGGKLLIALD
jgi:nitrite reductase/ring-hydroxylating ferredoxin subunit